MSENEASSSAHSPFSGSASSADSSLDLGHNLGSQTVEEGSRVRTEDSHLERQRIEKADKEGNEEATRRPHTVAVVRKPLQKVAVSFVDSMPTLSQAPGVLPLYPSFSIHALGKYFSYSHSSGRF